MARKKIEDTEKSAKIKCLKCGVFKVPSTQNYYSNSNQLFSSEKLEVCKECILKFIGDRDSLGYIDRVKTVLAIMDKPFDIELWTLRGEDWSKYIPQLSSFPQYKGKTFSNSTFEKQFQHDELSWDEDQIQLSSEDIRELSAFWGKGLSVEDYIFLQSEYEKFTNSYECDSYAIELLFQEASQQRLTIKKMRQAEKPVDKELKTLQDLLGSANIKPAQETGANATEQETFGTLIKKYEYERPIPEPDAEWKDVDGIKKYYQVWFLGHLCRMLGINNEYSEIYDEEISKYTVDIPKYETDEDDSA